MKGNSPVLALATLVTLLGCKDASAPENFNPAATGQRVNQALGVIQDNRAVQSVAVMAGAFTFAGTAPQFTEVGAPVAMTGIPGRPSASSAVANPSALLPAGALGKTFVYSPQSARYVTSDLTGAPANGSRFLLYAVDLATRTVVTPPQQIGNLELVDESSPAANTLGVQAIVNSAPVLDYDATGSISGTTFSFAARGHVSEGANRLDFDLSQSVSDVARIDYRITAPGQNNMTIRVVGTAPSESSANTTLTVTEAGDQLEITVNGSTQSANGTVKFNNRTLATLTAVGEADPVFAGSGGQVLTPDDLTGLTALYNTVDDLFERFDGLLVPAYFVFGLR